jgi:nucleoside-diphosphate-sugar epimerase
VLGLAEASANQTFNLDGARQVTVLEVAEAVRELVGSHVAIEHTPGRPGDYAGKLVSQEKSARVMGWESTTSFEEGMRRTYEWYRTAYPTNGATPQADASAG